MRRLARCVVVLALLGWLLPRPAAVQAQTCSPRPPITVLTDRNGAVTVTATTNPSTPSNALTGLAITSDPHYVGSQSNLVVDLPGRPPAQPPPQTVTLSPPQTSYTFAVRPLAPGPAATLPVTITDACGPWPTFVGGGPGILPTSQPTATPTATLVPPTRTPTRTPTAFPTPTTVPIPTSTPITAPVVGFAPAAVLQGNQVSLSWAGRTAPAVNDYLLITDAQGTSKGPAIFTSSCLTTTGTTAKPNGSCYIQLGPSFPVGTWQVRYYANGQSTLLASKTGLVVQAAGAAELGRGQAHGITSTFDRDLVAAVGGFIGNQAYLNAGDPGFITDVSFHHVGVADFGLLGNNFVEAGALKSCAPLNVPACVAFPYMSWQDNTQQLQQVVLDGRAGYDDLPLQISPGVLYQFKVFEIAATRWTGEACVGAPYNRCCPVWLPGSFCRPEGAGDAPPATLRIRFPWLFGGSETLDPRTASGLTHVDNAAYCCDALQSTWTSWGCWDHIWDQMDHGWTSTTVTNCVAPSSWDVVTQYR